MSYVNRNVRTERPQSNEQQKLSPCEYISL